MFSLKTTVLTLLGAGIAFSSKLLWNNFKIEKEKALEKEIAEELARNESLIRISGDIADSWVDLTWMMSSEHYGQKLDELSKNSNEWSDEFYKNVALIKDIKNRPYENVLYLSNLLFDKISEPTSVLQRRVLTVSAALYGFNIPRELCVIDEQTWTLLAQYSIVTMLLDMPQFLEVWKTNNPQDLKKYSQSELTRFYKILSYSSNVYHLLAELESERPPNFYNFKNMYATKYPKGFAMLKDSDEFKMLVTVAMTKAHLRVPRDYATVNDFIYDHLWCKSKNYMSGAVNFSMDEEKE